MKAHYVLRLIRKLWLAKSAFRFYSFPESTVSCKLLYALEILFPCFRLQNKLSY